MTKDVIKEFADDGVKYLELRSTPRGEDATGEFHGLYSPWGCKESDTSERLLLHACMKL